MRSIVVALNSLYGVHKNRALTIWLNEQFARKGVFEEGSITLSDISEDAIIKAITQVDAELNLTVDQFLRYIMLVPALSQNHQTFEPVVRFKSGLYKSILQNSKKIKINTIDSVRNGDQFERYGHDKHVLHKANPNNLTAPISMVYLNGTIKHNQQDFSVVLNEKEITATKAQMLESFYNGVDPYTSEEWEDVLLVSLFNRLYDEDIFLVLESILLESHIELYRKLKMFGKDRFEKNSGGSLKVYSSYGKHIGTKMFVFTAIQQQKERNEKPPVLTLVKGGNQQSKQSKQSKTEVPDDEKIMQDFGGF